MLPERKLSFGSGALATAAAYRFWEANANGRRFEAIDDFRGLGDEKMVALELELADKERAWQPALKS